MPPHKSVEECDKEVKKIEEEMIKLIKGKAPELVHMLKTNDDPNSRQSPQVGLGAISEETEETEDDLEDEFEEDEEEFDDEMDDEDEDEDSSKCKFSLEQRKTKFRNKPGIFYDS